MKSSGGLPKSQSSISELNIPWHMMRHLQPSIADDQPLVIAARKPHPLPPEFLLFTAANRMDCYQLLNMAMRLL